MPKTKIINKTNIKSEPDNDNSDKLIVSDDEKSKDKNISQSNIS